MQDMKCKPLPNANPSSLNWVNCLLSDFFKPQNVIFGRNIRKSILSFKQLLFGKQAYVWHHHGFLKEEKVILFSKHVVKLYFQWNQMLNAFGSLNLMVCPYSWLSRLKQQAQLALKLLNANRSLAKVFLSQVTGLQRSTQAACSNFLKFFKARLKCWGSGINKASFYVYGNCDVNCKTHNYKAVVWVSPLLFILVELWLLMSLNMKH